MYAYWNARVSWRNLALHPQEPQVRARCYTNGDAHHDSPEHRFASLQNGQIDSSTFYHQCLPERNRTFGLLQCGLAMRRV